MRTKDLEKITAGDSAYCWGIPQNSRQFQKALDLIRPNRTRLRGEVIEFTSRETFGGMVLLELLNAGLEDDLAMVGVAALSDWMSSDLSAGRDPRFIAVITDVDGDTFKAEYISRSD